jgi:DNA-binding transcriptional MerR regulator
LKDASASAVARRPPSEPATPPPQRLMRIGRFAELTGRSVHTIRWYEAQNLIPGVRRDPQQRRVYSDSHVEWLDLLDRLRRTGMTIRDIRDYASMVKRGDSTLRERQQLMRAHRRRVEAMMRDLTDSLALIDRKIDFYGAWLTTGKRPATSKRKPGPC